MVQAPASTLPCFPGGCWMSRKGEEEVRWSWAWQDSSATGKGQEGGWLGKPAPRRAANPAEIIGQNLLGEAASLSSPPALVAAAATEKSALDRSVEAREEIQFFLQHRQVPSPTGDELSHRREELHQNLCSSNSPAPKRKIFSLVSGLGAHLLRMAPHKICFYPLATLSTNGDLTFNPLSSF